MAAYARPIRNLLTLFVAITLVASACGDDSDGDSAEPPPEDPSDGETAAFYGGHESELYSEDGNWLCRPGSADNVCERDLDATVIYADGTTELEEHRAAEDATIDCFYVYPTVSSDEEGNSDLDPAETEEIDAALNQVARLSSVCDVYAPVYRQVTLNGISAGEGVEGDWDLAYGDVLDAFKHYVDNHSDGRDFVLVGHSQGSAHLRQLIMEEIDDEPELRERLVTAVLLGWSVNVPEGATVGGDFANVPLCEAADQTGCIVSYESFRANAPPPSGRSPTASCCLSIR
jgi:hypothetical protein